ncbi:PTS system mannose/fructose/sorbose family transporter subunit IID [Pelosinus sp. UFO1]|uniref:PTS system mannose/fructose/sorbose family transporter subunit IID n=1 Tax=Pelosinus sp. UFO1 TaxID=484770 RepID=UPI0008FF8F01
MSKAATILGVTVIGGLVASYIHIEVLSEIAINAEHSVSIQKDFLKKIFPNILPMSYALFMFIS